jgi:cell division protein FtsI/penicillin-binding protein 2
VGDPAANGNGTPVPALPPTETADLSESFYTGGGSHPFRNADTTQDQQTFSVRDAFVGSVNLPFIRIMRDIVHYHLYRLPGSAYLLRGYPAEAGWDRGASRRQEDVARAADGDGQDLIDRFYQQYVEGGSGTVLDALGRGRSGPQLAWAFRSVTPDAGLEEFRAFVRRHVAGPAPSDASLATLYDRSDPTGFSMPDRGHLSGVHPLELWLAAYLRRHPDARRMEVLEASAVGRELYRGLARPSSAASSDGRISPIAESDAFREIHRSWRRLGYPFESLVSSYATAIGSSADRPDQLAELVGILLNDGVRYPVRRVEALHFAAGTPYETLLRLAPSRGERVLSPEIAAVVRAAMVAVVARGTARRAFGALHAADGSPLPIGAKTGTGNNRYRVIEPDGRITEDRAIDRTSTVVFFLGDRFYGIITAFVPGADADRYSFTSSLPVQMLKMLGPTLERLISRPE